MFFLKECSSSPAPLSLEHTSGRRNLGVLPGGGVLPGARLHLPRRRSHPGVAARHPARRAASPLGRSAGAWPLPSPSTGFFTWNTILLVADSIEYGEVSYGMIPVPLWIPQSFMALGLIVLTIALVDDIVRVLRGKKPSYEGVGEGLLSE